MKAQQNAPKQQHGQRGSTLTGVIIGLVIGLAIAVGVAMVITKTSTPFTNKNGKTDKADLPLAQMQDPNKPLYGNKDAVSLAAKEVAASKAVEAAKPADALSAAANAAAAAPGQGRRDRHPVRRHQEARRPGPGAGAAP